MWIELVAYRHGTLIASSPCQSAPFKAALHMVAAIAIFRMGFFLVHVMDLPPVIRDVLGEPSVGRKTVTWLSCATIRHLAERDVGPAGVNLICKWRCRAYQRRWGKDLKCM